MRHLQTIILALLAGIAGGWVVLEWREISRTWRE